jgi:hypothetical protein
MLGSGQACHIPMLFTSMAPKHLTTTEMQLPQAKHPLPSGYEDIEQLYRWVAESIYL